MIAPNSLPPWWEGLLPLVWWLALIGGCKAAVWVLEARTRFYKRLLKQMQDEEKGTP